MIAIFFDVIKQIKCHYVNYHRECSIPAFLPKSVCPEKVVHNWAATRENLLLGFCDNKGADQPAHPRSLISAFVIHVLESKISRLAISEISMF